MLSIHRVSALFVLAVSLLFVVSGVAGFWMVIVYPDLIQLFASPNLIATVERGFADPAAPKMRFMGEDAIGIGVSMHAGGDILRLVIGQGAAVTAAGALVGIAGAAALTRVLEGLLYEISPTDTPTFAAVTAVLVTVALVACYIPARRATRIDPALSLRAE